MRTILILRHAKSDWHTGANDFDRPLNERGKKAAPLVGAEIASRNVLPDIILSSPAKRAKQTTKKIAKSCGFTGDVVFVEDFYYGNEQDVINALRKLPDNYKRPLIVGHNPTLEFLIFKLMAEKQEIALPTASLVLLKTDLKHWSELIDSSCMLEWHLRPREL